MQLDQLATVRQIAAVSPFSEATLRYWLFQRESNGLSKAVIRVGGRLYLDKEEFKRWLEQMSFDD